MIREVGGDDIFIAGDSFHPKYGSVSKTEAKEKAEKMRKNPRYLGVRVIHRERNMTCKVGQRYVPFRGWVIYVKLW